MYLENEKLVEIVVPLRKMLFPLILDFSQNTRFCWPTRLSHFKFYFEIRYLFISLSKILTEYIVKLNKRNSRNVFHA